MGRRVKPARELTRATPGSVPRKALAVLIVVVSPGGNSVTRIFDRGNEHGLRRRGALRVGRGGLSRPVQGFLDIA